jgi:hypothetical protein
VRAELIWRGKQLDEADLIASGFRCFEVRRRCGQMDFRLHAQRDRMAPRLARFDGEQLPDLKDKPCPYVGLEAFRDKKFFFGRDADTEDLSAQVRDSPLVIVFGGSGSGKSSLVMGGVLPALAVILLIRWRVNAAAARSLPRPDLRFWSPNSC